MIPTNFSYWRSLAGYLAISAAFNKAGAKPVKPQPGGVIETVVTYELVPVSPANISDVASAIVASANATSAVHGQALPTIDSKFDPFPEYRQDEKSQETSQPSKPALNIPGPVHTGTSQAQGWIPQPNLVAPKKAKGDKIRPSKAKQAALGHCSKGEPSIHFHNKSPHKICYVVENNPDVRIKHLHHKCAFGIGLVVAARKKAIFCPGHNFAGAITEFRGLERGPRFEFNFVTEGEASAASGTGKGTWYDVDYEMGLNSSTLSPVYHEPRVLNGQLFGSTAGVKNITARVDSAFQKLPGDRKIELLVQRGKYIQVDDAGKVRGVAMDKAAPFPVLRFLQMEANLTGYVVPGSVRGVDHLAGSLWDQMKTKADSFSWFVKSTQFVIKAYP